MLLKSRLVWLKVLTTVLNTVRKFAVLGFWDELPCSLVLLATLQSNTIPLHCLSPNSAWLYGRKVIFMWRFLSCWWWKLPQRYKVLRRTVSGQTMSMTMAVFLCVFLCCTLTMWPVAPRESILMRALMALQVMLYIQVTRLVMGTRQ